MVEEPVIASLAAKQQILVSILGADTRNVDGKMFGTMLISLPDDPQEKQVALAFLNAYQGVTAEEVSSHV
jgi:D-methionine transport system ATP-binding protein